MTSHFRWVGEAKDTKPTTAPIGSLFFETDTKDQFVFVCDDIGWKKCARNSVADTTGSKKIRGRLSQWAIPRTNF